MAWDDGSIGTALAGPLYLERYVTSLTGLTRSARLGRWFQRFMQLRWFHARDVCHSERNDLRGIIDRPVTLAVTGV